METDHDYLQIDLTVLLFNFCPCKDMIALISFEYCLQ